MHTVKCDQVSVSHPVPPSFIYDLRLFSSSFSVQMWHVTVFSIVPPLHYGILFMDGFVGVESWKHLIESL